VSIEGLWTSEMYGLQGWEDVGVIVLNSGHALGGGRHHSSVGDYTFSGGEFSMSLAITYHGQVRTLFGSSDKSLSIQVEGRMQGDKILGTVHRAGSPSLSLSFRLTKRAEMP
jgi:hypothetical protein